MKQEAEIEQKETDIFQQAVGLVKENQRLAQEREQAQEQVESLAKFFLENPNPVFRIARDGKLLFSNPPALALFSDNVIQIGDQVPPEFHKMVIHALSTQIILKSETKVGTQTFHLEWAPILREGYVSVYGRDITERKKAEAQMQMQYELTRIFLDGQSLEDTFPSILQAIGEFMEWEISHYWEKNPETDELNCRYAWNAACLNESEALKEFKKISFNRAFKIGTGLPGRVWDQLQPSWIPDVVVDANFPRAPFAEKLGMKSGFGFPIFFKKQFIGVVEIFTRQVCQPDTHLIQMMTHLGGQIGQWLRLKKAEEYLDKFNLKNPD